jgi:hypothetical protein
MPGTPIKNPGKKGKIPIKAPVITIITPKVISIALLKLLFIKSNLKKICSVKNGLYVLYV